MTSYPTNVSNSQWQIISKYLDVERSRKYELREIVNAILYLVKTGCQWRMLPGDFPQWTTVYYYFSVWKQNGILEEIHESLIEKIRKQHNKNEEPSVGIIDAQSVKSTLVSSQDKGFDAGKKVKGRKRHIIVDTLGLVLAVVIQSASVQDRNGADEVIDWMKRCWAGVEKLFADGGYSGKLVERVKKAFGIDVQIVEKNTAHAFQVLPKRWIVERTFAWLDTNRRKAKDYDRLVETSQAMI